MTDEAGARGLIRMTRVSTLLLVVGTLAGLVLVVAVAASMFVSTVGGIDVALSIVDGIRSERPLAFGILVIAGLFLVGYCTFLIVGFVRQTRRALDEQIHVRVTAAGVTVQREGSSFWQSSGVEIPFDAITAVEYLDPDESSLRAEFGDLRAPKFFAGRSQNWLRLERANDSAVYVGSDRPIELAETIARNVPNVERAEPF